MPNPFRNLILKIDVDRRSGKTHASIELDVLQQLIEANYQTVKQRDHFGETLEQITEQLPLLDHAWEDPGHICNEIDRILSERNIMRVDHRSF